MQIAFWSHYHQTGTTYNMIAAAVLMALDFPMKILVTHTHFDRSTLEKAFLEKRYLRHELTDLTDTGIDALSRMIKFNRLEKDDITSYTTTILNNRLDLLIGTLNTNRDIYFSNMEEVIQRIFRLAGKCYDLTFIDTAPGDNTLTLKILQQSDLVVVNLTQNLNMLEDFLSRYGDMKEKVLLLVARYDSDSRFNLKAIKRRFKMKDIEVVPYDIGFADACSESRIIDFFIKNQAADKADIHYPLVGSMRKTNQTILRCLGMEKTKA